MSVQGLTARSVTTGDAAEFLCFVGTLIYCVFLQFEFFLRSVTRISIHSVNYKMLNNCYVQRKKISLIGVIVRHIYYANTGVQGVISRK